MKNPRLGRPKTKLVKPKATVTERVRRLVDLAHDGNVHEASHASGVAYGTLRDLYSGRSTNPNLSTLDALARTYVLYVGWFTDPTQPDAVPMGGWVCTVPRRAGDTSRQKTRNTVIPFSAWPLVSVVHQLEATLGATPKTRDRPIWGDTENEDEQNLRLATFLLLPILEAERATGKELVLNADRLVDGEAQERWILTLRVLGKFWQALLPNAIESMRKSDRS
jgi:hypothetical protein